MFKHISLLRIKHFISRYKSLIFVVVENPVMVKINDESCHPIEIPSANNAEFLSQEEKTWDKGL